MALVSAPAFGVHCAIDQVPAATLLVPYFEVNLGDASGTTTIVWMTNTSSDAALAHVTVWTTWGIPALGFDVYFTGHDVQTFNLRDVTGGLLPRTASDSQDPTDTISPQGPRSDDDGYASCNGVLPPANLGAPAIADLRAKLTGQPIPSSGLCAGANLGDNVARGYVTVDMVTGCTQLNPSSPGYFAGIADDANLLTGEVMLVEPSTGTAFSYPVVHLEAATLPPGARSFYGRFVGDSGADGREPLPASFAARFSKPVPAATSRLFVWRETGDEVEPVACGGAPAWAPLPTKPVLLFDEQTQSAKAPAALPIAAQRLDLFSGSANPYASGLAVLDLGYVLGARPAQAFVTSLQLPSSSPEESLHVHQLEDACTGSHYFPLLRDGFENGFVPWSGSSP
jgi:hypothetical protein